MSGEAMRPGLSELPYRPGTYASFRRAMIEDLSRPRGLTRLTSRRSDDYGITLLELWAAVGDVLGFYQERFANEAFLGTAVRTESVARLAALLDYRLAPGAAAVARLAFTMEPGKAAKLPAALRVQSLPGAGERPQVYETLEELRADARLNALRAFPAPVSTPKPLAAGEKTLTLDRTDGPELAAGLAAGARVVVFRNGDTTPLEEKVVADVRTEDDRTVVEWTEPVKAPAWAAGGLAYPSVRTFRLFGHGAPPTFMEPTELSARTGGGPTVKTKALELADGKLAGTDAMVGTSDFAAAGSATSAPPRIVWNLRSLQPAYPRSGNAAEGAVESGTSRLCLDGRFEGLAAGAKLLVADTRPGGVKRLVTIRSVDQAHDAFGPLADTVTRVTVTPALGTLPDRRAVVVYELGRELVAWPERYPARLTGDRVYLPGRLVDGGAGVEVGRRIVAGALSAGVVVRPDDVEVGRGFVLSDAAGGRVSATLKAIPAITAADAAGFCHLVLELDVDGTLDLDALTAVLNGNVARASHGESVRDEVLGNGDASAPFQRFRIRRTPLTLVPGFGEGGVRSTLELLVDGVQWQEVPTLYGRPPDARVYTTRLADDGTTEVRFGDGEHGARLTTGRGNVRASYRFGLGLEGRVGADALTTALDRPPGLLGVTNPLAATGGADPETLEAARRNAPRTVRTFGRAVSLEDVEHLVTASGEVAKAQATWAWDGLGRVIHLTVAAQGGGLFTEEDLRRLTSALTAARDPNHPLRLANYEPVDVVVRTSVAVEADRRRADVEGVARAALLDALSFDAQTLGRAFGVSDVYRVLQEVPGVASVDVDELAYADPAQAAVRELDPGKPVQPRILVFPARPETSVPGGVHPAELARLASPTNDATVAATGGLAS